MTPLRRKMLEKVAAGDVSRGLGVSGWAIRGWGGAHGHACNAVSWLVVNGYCRIPAGARYDTPLELLTPGREALDRFAGRTA